jgi:replication-associated recombination protein RarA
MSLFPDTQAQPGFAFPQPLSEKYRPRTLGEFIGLEKQKKILMNFTKQPCSCAWLFVGPSGTGKSTAAMAMCNELHAEMHKIPSQNCNLQSISDTVRQCWYAPYSGGFHMVLADEADQMSNAAQLALLSKLDSTDPVPATIWVFTANDTERLEKRFLSRCRVLEFSSYGMRSELAGLLAHVWEAETGQPGTLDFERVAKDSTNNVREALSRLEMELLAQ